MRTASSRSQRPDRAWCAPDSRGCHGNCPAKRRIPSDCHHQVDQYTHGSKRNILPIQPTPSASMNAREPRRGPGRSLEEGSLGSVLLACDGFEYSRNDIKGQEYQQQ